MTTLRESYSNEATLDKYIPESGDVAFDVGCNQGKWTKVLSPKFRTVHAIDAQPQCCEDIAALGLPNIVIREMGAWSCTGSLMFHDNINKAGERQGAIVGVDEFVVVAREENRFEVKCATLDSIRIHGCLDFMKMDVDGSEVSAIIGAQSLLRKHKPTLIIECHTDEARAYLLIYLAKFGYSPRIVEENRIPADADRWTDEVNYLYAERPK